MLNRDPGEALQEAEALMRQRNYDAAETLLRDLTADMPEGWTPVRRSEFGQGAAFWDIVSFLSYLSFRHPEPEDKNVIWSPLSYSKALYYLAFIALERDELDTALEDIGKALDLEPDHPLLLSERGAILSRLGRHEEALAMQMRALEVRPWAPWRERAKAMRGATVALIDLHRLDEAEEMLGRALDLEPDSEAAKQEMAYIQHLRHGGPPAEEYAVQ